MMRQLTIAFIMFLLMTFINVIGGVVNGFMKLDGTLKDVPDTMVFIGIFCIIYLFIVHVKVRVDDALKLPVVRSIFWFCVVLTDIGSDSIYHDYTAGYVLYLVDAGLCLLWIVPQDFIWKSCTDCNFIVQVIILNVFLFAVYEFIIIRASTIVADRYVYPLLKAQFSDEGA